MWDSRSNDIHPEVKVHGVHWVQHRPTGGPDYRLRCIPVCAAGPDVKSFNRTHSGFQPSAPLTSESHNTRHDRKHMRSGQGSWRRERERDRSIELLKPHQQRASCFIDFPETASAVQQGQQKRQEKKQRKMSSPKNLWDIKEHPVPTRAHNRSIGWKTSYLAPLTFICAFYDEELNIFS